MENPPPESANRELSALLLSRALEEAYAPRAARTVFALGKKEKLYELAAKDLGTDPITYLEFGVYRGWSMRRIAQRFTAADARFFGFDSFRGLPEQWGSVEPGHFSTSGDMPAISDPRVSFVQGWFQNSVPPFLAAHTFNGPVLVHFDADLYSSTLFLLTTLWHHIDEYHFLFDELLPEEIVALRDFWRAYPVQFEFFAATVDGRQRQFQAYGRMKRTGLSAYSQV
jgi:O-methyltransferase